ncbi:hypothetical protein MRY82_03340 [bacterium]|nr:hypothetical protein [bacterium]
MSEAVRVGKVTRTYSSWDPENKMIYTYVKLNVSQTVKGEPAKEVLMKIPGGESNGVQMRVHGVAHFKKGEETMVFLRNHQGAPTVVGMAQGKYIVSTDPQSGKKMVSRHLPKSLEFVQNKAVQQIQGLHKAHTHQHEHAVTVENDSMELSEMVHHIQEAMEKEVH